MKSIFLTISILAIGFYCYGFGFLAPVLAISFLIFFHELGHFLAAKSLGVCVETFSVGFGDKILSKKVGKTDYCLSAIPLGGYVKLKGQDDLNPNSRSDDDDSYNKLSPLGRIYILFAGPFFNLILAFFIYILVGFIGIDELAPKIGQIGKHSAASEAGLMVGDEILSINDKKVSRWDDISKYVENRALDIKILRNNEILNFTVNPKISEKRTIWGEKIQAPLIGVAPNGNLIKIYHTGFSSLNFALDKTLESSKIILLGLEKLVTGVVSVKEMGGIIAITDVTSKAASYGFSTLLLLVALISVNLGIINLFPIPALDGGHIVFNLYELIFRRPVPQSIFTAMSYAGMAILATLMIFTILNDFARILGFYK